MTTKTNKYIVYYTNSFNRDLKKAIKQNRRLDELYFVIDLLANGIALPPKYKNHPLKGEMQGHWDCHIGNDFVLIYRYDYSNNRLALVNLGTHSELFFNLFDIFSDDNICS